MSEKTKNKYRVFYMSHEGADPKLMGRGSSAKKLKARMRGAVIARAKLGRFNGMWVLVNRAGRPVYGVRGDGEIFRFPVH